MADDREFDRLLEEELSALPLPDETVEEITPWKRAMTRIVWGVGLTTCTLNFWYLNYLLPAVGVVLLLLGFRTLRRENRWFAFCWAAAAVDAAAFFFLRVKDATLWSGTNVPFGEALALLQLAQSFCLWQGIKAVRRAAGQEDRAGAAAALLVFQTVLTALGLMSGWALQLQGLIFVVPILILYICIMRSLARLPALLDGNAVGCIGAGKRPDSTNDYFLFSARIFRAARLDRSARFPRGSTASLLLGHTAGKAGDQHHRRENPCHFGCKMLHVLFLHL